MKILFIKSETHIKNLHFILKCKLIDFTIVIDVDEIINLDLLNFDAVYSPCNPIDVSKYPTTKFIFGPHFSIFPKKQHIELIESNNVIYIQPSEWVVKIWQENSICKNIKIIPFFIWC
jgi:hypothetical protein